MRYQIENSLPEIPLIAEDGLRQTVADRWNSLTKPPGSLGALEPLVTKLALIAGHADPVVDRQAMLIFCGDHGITAAGVSAYPRTVTGQMVRNFIAGGAAISVLCRRYGIRPMVIDTGVDGELAPGAVDCRIASGTANFLRAKAMTLDQTSQALWNGIGIARRLRPECDLAGAGEMGIGNSTAASALLCAYTGIRPAEAVGPGTGLNDAGVRWKADVITGALAIHGPLDPFRTLAAYGGFEIATMVGFFIGAASLRLPVLVDGFIASAAALAAVRIAPSVSEFLLYAHVSAEPAHRRLLDALAARPLLDLDMRLGEGSGAALAMPLVSAAVALYSQMATFRGSGVSERSE